MQDVKLSKSLELLDSFDTATLLVLNANFLYHPTIVLICNSSFAMRMYEKCDCIAIFTYNFLPLNLKLFATTETELKAMAAPASIGSSRKPKIG